jgi:hypothetical protein
MTQLNIYGGASLSLADHWSEIFLEIINCIRQFFYQTEFQSISKHQFNTEQVMRILNIRHVISQ